MPGGPAQGHAAAVGRAPGSAHFSTGDLGGALCLGEQGELGTWRLMTPARVISATSCGQSLAVPHRPERGWWFCCKVGVADSGRLSHLLSAGYIVQEMTWAHPTGGGQGGRCEREGAGQVHGEAASWPRAPVALPPIFVSWPRPALPLHVTTS